MIFSISNFETWKSVWATHLFFVRRKLFEILSIFTDIFKWYGIKKKENSSVSSYELGNIIFFFLFLKL